ncbi:hypothetical protein C8R45DRAFT_1071400 [Mycena sanguinolenta]|nr:hypothetical protein C8R45DRAFT_1071400 [Mycena sanguinolenta]
MDTSLPEETISEILSLALHVPDDMFSDTSLVSPFAKFSVSASSILLVNKTWLRIATPLLLETVIIRSKPQANALATALKGKQNLGRFVKKLRLEGGFGKYMQSILQQTPNITDLFLSAMLWAADNVSWLVLGLPLLNPRRLILLDPPDQYRSNSSISQLFLGIAESMEKWVNLTTLELPVLPHGKDRQPFKHAICSSKTLQLVSLTLRHSVDDLDYDILNEMADNPSLKAIEIHNKIKDAEVIIDAEATKPRLRSLMRIINHCAVTSEAAMEENSANNVTPLQKNAVFCPMSSASQSVVDLIWKRILFFAMFAVAERPSDADSLQPPKTNSDRLNILLVSKTFKRLGLPYLYGYPVFSDEISLQQFSDRLYQDHTAGPHVRELEIYRFKVNKRRKPQPLLDLIPLFCRTPTLTRLIGNGIQMSWSTFNTLAHTAGNTLVEFRGFVIESDPGTKQLSPMPFNKLRTLQSLTWEAQKMFVPRYVHNWGPVDALPSLTFLHVKSPGLLSALSDMGLPALRSVVLDAGAYESTEFLGIHGNKISELEIHHDFNTGDKVSVFFLCHALSHVTLHWTCNKSIERDSKNTPVLTLPEQHLSLTKLVVQKDIQGKSLTTDLEEWRDFFAAMKCEEFPALREVQILYGHFKWPTTEHAISKSPWVKWAERLLEKNIKLTNPEGVHWRPRFKGPRRGNRAQS